jgi:hypothetical protein
MSREMVAYGAGDEESSQISRNDAPKNLLRTSDFNGYTHIYGGLEEIREPGGGVTESRLSSDMDCGELLVTFEEGEVASQSLAWDWLWCLGSRAGRRGRMRKS